MPLFPVAAMLTTTGHGVAAPAIWTLLTYLLAFCATGAALYTAAAASMPLIPLA